MEQGSCVVVDGIPRRRARTVYRVREKAPKSNQVLDTEANDAQAPCNAKIPFMGKTSFENPTACLLALVGGGRAEERGEARACS